MYIHLCRYAHVSQVACLDLCVTLNISENPEFQKSVKRFDITGNFGLIWHMSEFHLA